MSLANVWCMKRKRAQCREKLKKIKPRTYISFVTEENETRVEDAWQRFQKGFKGIEWTIETNKTSIPCIIMKKHNISVCNRMQLDAHTKAPGNQSRDNDFILCAHLKENFHGNATRQY